MASVLVEPRLRQVRDKLVGTESRRARALMPSPQFPNQDWVKPKAYCVLSRTGGQAGHAGKRGGRLLFGVMRGRDMRWIM